MAFVTYCSGRNVVHSAMSAISASTEIVPGARNRLLAPAPGAPLPPDLKASLQRLQSALAGWTAELTYVGNYGYDIEITRNINALPNQLRNMPR